MLTSAWKASAKRWRIECRKLREYNFGLAKESFEFQSRDRKQSRRIFDLEALLEVWLNEGRFLAGNSPRKDAIVETTRKILEQKE